MYAIYQPREMMFDMMNVRIECFRRLMNNIYIKNLLLKYRSLLILITAFIVLMAVVSSPTVNLLSNNYLLYHYQAFAAKARAHVMNDNDDDNSAKDTAATSPVICPN